MNMHWEILVKHVRIFYEEGQKTMIQGGDKVSSSGPGNQCNPTTRIPDGEDWVWTWQLVWGVNNLDQRNNRFQDKL